MDDLAQLAAIETPAALLDLAKLELNLEAMQRLAAAHGVALRPQRQDP